MKIISLSMASAILLLLNIAAAEDNGGVTIYKSLDEVGLDKPIPLDVTGTAGLKIAFLAKGKTEFTLECANKGAMVPYGFKDTNGYDWIDDGWRPCLYRVDLFRDTGTTPTQGSPITCLKFDVLQHAYDVTSPINQAGPLRNFVVYRGEDKSPPEAPHDLAASAKTDGVHLSWKAAADNVGVAWYVISRATAAGKFVKIGQSASLDYTDKAPAAGPCRYRVLAADFERNLGPWSNVVSVQTQTSSEQADSALEKDRRNYAEHVRTVHDAGVGKVEKGSIFYIGDGPTHLHRFREQCRDFQGLFTDCWVNKKSDTTAGFHGDSSQFVAELEGELKFAASQKRTPELCVIMVGIDSPRSTPEECQKIVDSLRKMAKICEGLGTVPIVTTTTQWGLTDPRNSPEQKLNDAILQMCETDKIPAVRVFDFFLKAAEDGNFKKWMQPPNPKWAPAATYPVFEDGLKARNGAFKKTLDQVLFVLLDRPE